MFYPVAMRCITSFEVNGVPVSTTMPDPDYGLTLSPLIGAVLVRHTAALHSVVQ